MLYNEKHTQVTLISTENIALNKPAFQSSTGWGGEPGRATDGDSNPSWAGATCTHTTAAEPGWLVIDLQGNYGVTSVSITNRADCCCKLYNIFGLHQLSNINCAMCLLPEDSRPI